MPMLRIPVCCVLQFIHHPDSLRPEKAVGCYLSEIFECDLPGSLYRRIIFSCYTVKVVLSVEIYLISVPFTLCFTVQSGKSATIACAGNLLFRSVCRFELKNNNTQDRLCKSA